jgi:hypothetical protein
LSLSLQKHKIGKKKLFLHLQVPLLIGSYFQELLEEVRKELQKMKEEIIEGKVLLFCLKISLSWRQRAHLERKGEGTGLDL